MLYMDGGIDLVYSRRMFTNVERAVKARCRRLQIVSAFGRPYLPLASAMITKVDDALNTVLVSAPTMYRPQNVSSTRNAYHAFMATLAVVHKFGCGIDTIVCPALCCGYGKMAPRVSAEQIHDAYVDFHNGRIPKELSHKNLPDVFICHEPKEEQP